MLGFTTLPVVASSILQFTFDELNDHADLIVEGRVVAAESRVEPGGQIATYVRIAVLERLKGPDVGSELELRFAGGSVAGLSLEIADMRLPAVGEVGIYFVESLLERQVHPLVGWSQGHFVELNDPTTGRPGVFTPEGKAVLGIGRDISLTRRRQVVPGTGTALEVQVEGGAAVAPQSALAVSEFKDRIRRSIAAVAADPVARP
jgi:hypothetical protein